VRSIRIATFFDHFQDALWALSATFREAEQRFLLLFLEKEEYHRDPRSGLRGSVKTDNL
jgi:hypothetical protein